MNIIAIAQHLSIAADAIITVEEWATVLWVKFVGGCRFVSKKVVKMLDTSNASQNVQNRIKWYLEFIQKGKQQRADHQLDLLKSYLRPLAEQSQLDHMKSVKEQYDVDCQVINAFLASI